MRLRLKHFRHPIRTASIAKALVVDRWRRRRFARIGHRRYSRDPRYNLQAVSDGFSSRPDRVESEESEYRLLERICDSYHKAIRAEASASEAYRATPWWQDQRKWNLDGVIHALSARHLPALGRMYRNFYRDRCSGGLIASQAISQDYFGRTIKDFHRRLYLVNALYRLDHWRNVTNQRFTISDLRGPSIGNPYGVVVEGTLIRAGAEYQHYCADRVARLLNSKQTTVAEVGGGFGGMAYYLLRDHPRTKYIDFDVPESIALTTYYLARAFPNLKFLLYGEDELTLDAISQADIVLMPVFQLAALPPMCVDLTFSSHTMSDLAPFAAAEYLKNVAFMTTRQALVIGNTASVRALSDVPAFHSWFKAASEHRSDWHAHLMNDVSEVECLYEVVHSTACSP